MGNETTLQLITEEILKFCNEIDPSIKPIQIKVKPADNMRFNFCHTDVPKYAKEKGGSVVFGWIIWECLKVFLNAEFHACWKDPKGILFDIVFKPDGEKRILFLPDSERTYQNELVDNKRKPLIENGYTKFWQQTERKRFEIRKNHFKNDEVDAIAAESEFQEWINFSGLVPKIGRNDPCFCCSGIKYKKCCGKNQQAKDNKATVADGVKIAVLRKGRASLVFIQDATHRRTLDQ